MNGTEASPELLSYLQLYWWLLDERAESGFDTQGYSIFKIAPFQVNTIAHPCGDTLLLTVN